ncbi:KGK domain-containing protein [Oscillatoria sp. HE19RPO]|uniref:KGK domain-containing protein n=1 Tax=Oscillatoria sp. HE19RPO TaxID=2954806 RepID=UPI0020C295FD|nr:KGK domain-containing protein [Oscillatoria sp. HE19RPO]
MNHKVETLKDDEVVSVPQANQRIPILNHPMIKFGDLRQALTKVIKTHFLGIGSDADEKLKWLGEGVDVEILKYGSPGWKKGKVRIKISLEFCSDEPEYEEIAARNKGESSELESPLDEIRRMQG